jgi:asparagine synthase (glutamine-hydrolysing)
MAPAASHPGEKLHKIAQVLRSDSRKTAYKALASQWQDPYGLLAEQGVDGSSVRAEPVEASGRKQGLEPQPTNPFNPEHDYAAWMMCADTLGYLPDDILVKVDRAAMGVSLESRVPLLDHRVVELAWSLPQHLKIRQGQGKWLLRQVLDRHVPRRLIDRPKTGFAVPVGDWLRGPLREWAESLLDERGLALDGHLDPKVVRQTWERQLAGQGRSEHQIWSVLMFQAWLDKSRTSGVTDCLG